MSIAAMSWAWKQDIDPTTKFVLLALSDHANDVDFTCWPSLTHLELKTGYSRPTIWKAIDRLVSSGFMRRVGLHQSGATLYEVVVGNDVTQQVTSLPRLGNDVNGVGNVGNKLGNDVTPNHKNHHEPSVTINRFIKPPIEEIKSYCLERQNSVDPQAFMDYYTSNGWKVGRNPMKDWKAAVRTWEKNSRKPSKGRKTFEDYQSNLEAKINAAKPIRGDAERVD
ncbi:MAG: helix-turn-helix domain-containing protein [Candidatus Omnitrophica bacterium]|nr:helix-turn-helix domain-containing protein [Candidatus Omnitrophota bacterium]